MKTFNMFKHPTHGVEAVKLGFSWPAFFFGLPWMLVKKLWGIAGAVFAIYLAATLIETVAAQSANDGAQALVYLMLLGSYLALWLVPAFKGNAWRALNLKSRGYELIGTIQAETPDAALAQVVKRPGTDGLPMQMA